ncbi:MAG: hypothetical protein IJV43_08510 [Oscillospiraceae bacterium]|nr:hypothetical protein [Oscillospiraceae bacterium]
MARRPTRQVNSRYASGNLAYDYDYLEREQRRRAEREQREYAERRARETVRRPEPRRRVVEAPKRRERIRVSPAVVLGFAAAAAMVVMLLMSYAQLTAISHEVVRQQKELASLQEEHVKLIARYERTFDLTAIKEAAEATGMAKPSASQIYYVDLSAPDNVVLYERAEANVLGRVFTSVGQDVVSVVEYFK